MQKCCRTLVEDQDRNKSGNKPDNQPARQGRRRWGMTHYMAIHSQCLVNVDQ
jgi:cytosine/uracil/thiamine/allantoin permease